MTADRQLPAVLSETSRISNRNLVLSHACIHNTSRTSQTTQWGKFNFREYSKVVTRSCQCLPPDVNRGSSVSSCTMSWIQKHKSCTSCLFFLHARFQGAARHDKRSEKRASRVSEGFLHRPRNDKSTQTQLSFNVHMVLLLYVYSNVFYVHFNVCFSRDLFLVAWAHRVLSSLLQACRFDYNKNEERNYENSSPCCLRKERAAAISVYIRNGIFFMRFKLGAVDAFHKPGKFLHWSS